jgi:hypothetical protein
MMMMETKTLRKTPALGRMRTNNEQRLLLPRPMVPRLLSPTLMKILTRTPTRSLRNLKMKMTMNLTRKLQQNPSHRKLVAQKLHQRPKAMKMKTKMKSHLMTRNLNPLKKRKMIKMRRWKNLNQLQPPARSAKTHLQPL